MTPAGCRVRIKSAAANAGTQVERISAELSTTDFVEVEKHQDGSIRCCVSQYSGHRWNTRKKVHFIASWRCRSGLHKNPGFITGIERKDYVIFHCIQAVPRHSGRSGRFTYTRPWLGALQVYILDLWLLVHRKEFLLGLNCDHFPRMKTQFNIETNLTCWSRYCLVGCGILNPHTICDTTLPCWVAVSFMSRLGVRIVSVDIVIIEKTYVQNVWNISAQIPREHFKPGHYGSRQVDLMDGSVLHS